MALTVPLTAGGVSNLQSPGSVQRWVRLCDAAHEAGEEDPVVLQVLDAILRTADPAQVSPLPPQEPSLTPVHRLLPWDVGGRRTPFALPPPAQEKYKDLFHVVAVEKGPDRRPPNLYDLNIWTSRPGTIELEPR